MTHSKLVAKLCKPGADIIKDLTPESAHLWHMATGITGEVHELFEQIAARQAGDEGNILEETGDILFYVEGLLQGIGTTLQVLPKNLTHDLPPMVGLVCRAGDVLDAAKKCAVYKSAANVERLSLNIAYLLIYLSEVIEPYGFCLTQARQHNIDKLTVRYGRTYSNEAAQLRKDKA